MSDSRNHGSELIDILLFYLRFNYLSATECLVYLFLYCIADRGGRGYVNQAVLSKQIGRSKCRCRGYLNHLRRHGLIDTLRSDATGGLHFKLEMAVVDSETGKNEGEGQPDGRNTAISDSGTDQVSTAGYAPAPRQPKVGTPVLRRLK